MQNQAMQRKLNSGVCVDISQLKRLGPYYVLPEFVDGVDYADARTESWVWSIGRCESDFSFSWLGTICVAPKGTILVSLGADLYQRAGVECLWLR